MDEKQQQVYPPQTFYGERVSPKVFSNVLALKSTNFKLVIVKIFF